MGKSAMFSWCLQIMCRFMWFFTVDLYWQAGHWKGFSPVWVRVWRNKSLLLWNTLPHKLHCLSDCRPRVLFCSCSWEVKPLPEAPPAIIYRRYCLSLSLGLHNKDWWAVAVETGPVIFRSEAFESTCETIIPAASAEEESPMCCRRSRNCCRDDEEGKAPRASSSKSICRSSNDKCIRSEEIRVHNIGVNILRSQTCCKLIVYASEGREVS